MTISQSRYGANAEVGRNMEVPKKDRNKAELATVAGVGAIAGGAGLHRMGTLKANNATNATKESFANYRELAKNPRIPKGDPSGKGGKFLKPTKEQTKAKVEARKIADRNLMELPKAMKSGKRLNRVGLATIGTGALLTGASGAAVERKRGTLGYRRETLAERRNKQANVRNQAMEQSKTEGDRYRQMNGM